MHKQDKPCARCGKDAGYSVCGNHGQLACSCCRYRKGHKFFRTNGSPGPLRVGEMRRGHLSGRVLLWNGSKWSSYSLFRIEMRIKREEEQRQHATWEIEMQQPSKTPLPNWQMRLKRMWEDAT